MSKKKWPVEQLLDWLEKIDSKYVRLQSNDLSTLIAILKFADNQTLECFPSIEKISRITMKSKTRVRDVIKRLVNLEILSIKKRYSPEGDRDSNKYIYNPNMLWGVGAICSLPWVTFVAYGGLRLLPLTTNITTHVTKKQVATPKFDQKQKHEPRQTAKFWEAGNPDYDRQHQKN